MTFYVLESIIVCMIIIGAVVNDVIPERWI